MCAQQGTKVKEYMFWPCVWGKSNNTSLSNCPLIFKRVGGCVMVWACLTSAKTVEFLRMKRNGMKLSRGKILEKNLL